MADSTIDQLGAAISKLQAERATYVSEIAQIDATFAELGITAQQTAAPARRKPGRPPKAKTAEVKASKAKPAKTKAAKPAKTVKKQASRKPAGRSTRGSYKQTASQFIMTMFTGDQDLATSQIIGNWKKAKRGGKPDNALTKLVKNKDLKRVKVKGGRGSTYRTG